MNTKIAIIGLGMIGGSIAASIKRQRHLPAGDGDVRSGVHSIANNNIVITAFDCNRTTLDYALQHGLIDYATASIKEAIDDAELIIIATPIHALSMVFQAIKSHLTKTKAKIETKADANTNTNTNTNTNANTNIEAKTKTPIITDVASVKQLVIKIAQQELQEFMPQFVPAHPLAGTEHSGIEAAVAGLFTNHRVILTPLAAITDRAAIDLVQQFWQVLHADVQVMGAAKHDALLAITSHLPHVLAYAFGDAVVSHPQREDILQNRGRSFGDFTRVLASDPKLWRDIFLANREAVLAAIKNFRQSLEKLQTTIDNQDDAALLAILEDIKVAEFITSDELMIGYDAMALT